MIKHWLLSLLLLFFVIEVFSVLPSRHKSLSKQDVPPYFVRGLINVHSTLSDGALSIPESAQLAAKLGNSFVVFADQDSVEGRRLGLEQQYGTLDAFIEMETKTPSGELVFFFSHTPLSNLKASELSALGYEIFLGAKRNSDAFVSISHPSHIKKPWTQLELFPDGLELFNFDSLFLRKLYTNPLDFLGLALLYPLNPFMTSLRLVQPYSKDFAMWDNMNSMSSKHFGIWSSQFTQKLNLSFLNIQWPSSSEIFSFASNIVFLKKPLATSFSERKKQIYESIQEGRLALSVDSIYPFQGNDFVVKCGELEFRSGDSLNQNPNSCVAYVRLPNALPYKSKVRLLREGELVKEVVSFENEILFPLKQAGSYRVEVWARPHSLFWILLRKWVPYVFYNSIHIK